MALGDRCEDWCCYVQIAEEETRQLSSHWTAQSLWHPGRHCATGGGARQIQALPLRVSSRQWGQDLERGHPRGCGPYEGWRRESELLSQQGVEIKMCGILTPDPTLKPTFFHLWFSTLKPALSTSGPGSTFPAAVWARPSGEPDGPPSALEASSPYAVPQPWQCLLDSVLCSSLCSSPSRGGSSWPKFEPSAPVEHTCILQWLLPPLGEERRYTCALPTTL